MRATVADPVTSLLRPLRRASARSTCACVSQNTQTPEEDPRRGPLFHTFSRAQLVSGKPPSFGHAHVPIRFRRNANAATIALRAANLLGAQRDPR
jgi:hypothetical protein